jgi:hypothetical protein
MSDQIVSGSQESSLSNPESVPKETKEDESDPKKKNPESDSNKMKEGEPESDVKKPESDQDKAEPPNDCYKYDESGIMVYTDPVSKVEYVLDPSGSNWIPKSESVSKYQFDGTTYTYTDEGTGVKHRWDLDKHEWITVSGDDR